MPCDETRHFAHDYKRLVRRWRLVAQQTGLKMIRFAEADGYPVYTLGPRRGRVADGLYFSAGIHGDEPASTEGLIDWAETHLETVASLPLRLFPCLNPWGLVGNLRCDADGRDLNRSFDPVVMPPLLQNWANILKNESYRLVCHLHEDYDAQGIYLYETQLKRLPWLAEELIRAVEPVLARDPRASIEGRKACRACVQRRLTPALKKIGMAEAFYLIEHGADRAITFETPSEFGLSRRVAAQVRFIETCCEWFQSRA